MNRSENVPLRVNFDARLRRIVILFNEFALRNLPDGCICSRFTNCCIVSSFSGDPHNRSRVKGYITQAPLSVPVSVVVWQARLDYSGHPALRPTDRASRVQNCSRQFCRTVFSSNRPKNIIHFKLVGTIGLEPTTPTMSR